jgi:hypothetical protein
MSRSDEDVVVGRGRMEMEYYISRWSSIMFVNRYYTNAVMLTHPPDPETDDVVVVVVVTAAP